MQCHPLLCDTKDLGSYSEESIVVRRGSEVIGVQKLVDQEQGADKEQDQRQEMSEGSKRFQFPRVGMTARIRPVAVDGREVKRFGRPYTGHSK